MSLLNNYTNQVRQLKLSQNDSSEAFEIIMNGKAELEDLILFLTSLNEFGITEDHMIGAVNIMKDKMVKVDIPNNSIDTCGTGGDGKFSLNISTAVAFVLSALNIPVAKHGNRSITSNCGSADVLKSLGINIDFPTDRLTECIHKTGICFMFAPFHHPAMKHVAEVRQVLGKKGIKTIFNMLGPLLNPGNVNKQIIGVFSENVQDIYQKVFNQYKDKEAFIVLGNDGMDELSTLGKNKIIHNNECLFFDPLDIKIKRPLVEELTGKTPDFNASRIIDIFSGIKDSFYEIVSVNAALGLVLYRNLNLNNDNMTSCLTDVKMVLDDGSALNQVEKLKKFTKDL